MKLACPICNGSNLVKQRQLKCSEIVRCSHCGVEFLDPQPSHEELAAMYSANYFFSDSDGVSEAEIARLKRRTAELYVNSLVCLRGGATGALLEIGCGRGDFLLAAQARGFQVKGVEVSEYAAAIANRKLDAEVVEHGEIDTVRLPEGGFDVAVFSDVIEHVRDPRDFLRRVRVCLRPGGLLFVATPTTDSWSRRLMGKQWMEYKTEHLFYFNRRSLRYLLEDCGYCGLEFRRNWKALSLNYVRAHFRRYRAPVWSGLVETIGRLIPAQLAARPFTLVASGVTAIGRKGR